MTRAGPNRPKIIHATDHDSQMISTIKAATAQRQWSVEAAVVSLDALSFSDDTFDLSFTNFVIHLSSKNAQISSEIYRTLRPGGTAVLKIWRDPVLPQAAQAAFDIVRLGMPYPPSIERAWFSATHLYKLLHNAGFKPENVRFESTEAILHIFDVESWSTVVWSFLGSSIDGWAADDEE